MNCVEGKLTDAFAPKTAHLCCSWPRPKGTAPVDLQAAERELDGMRRQDEARLEGNVALFYRGASLEASWGLPTNVRAFPWQRMIDGYRGTTWPLGSRGFLPRDYRFPPEMRAPDRWLEVRLAEKQPLGRAAVITSDVEYELAVQVDGEWRAVPPASEQGSDQYHESLTAAVRTFSLDGVTSDRVRLIMPNSPPEGVNEVYYEIEVYRPEDHGA